MIRYGVLGPLTIARNGVPIKIVTPMLRRLLTVLLCRAPRPVSVAEAVDALWGDSPPPSASKTLQVYVHRLRRAIGAVHIDHGPSGYLLHVEAQQLDARRFTDLLGAARTAYGQSRLDRAGELLMEALALWRGAAYAEVEGAVVAQEVARLEEEHLLAHEEFIVVELDRGRHAEVIATLSSLVDRNPYREKLRGQLMMALYHSGRQAEALEVYRATYALLMEDLGVEPVPALRQLHESILRGDLAPPARRRVPVTSVPIPRELPRDVWAFAGRADALRALDAELPDDGTQQVGPGTIVISAVSGMAGVGKTALAVHWAHRVASRFPDGQLYVDLRGFSSGSPMRPIDVLALLLRALGVAADEVPVDLDVAARTYRTLLADRRILIVLDNARDAPQVRPLLPGGPGCLVLVTSRDRLTGLVARNGARRLVLDVLPPAESATLLGRVFAENRIRVDAAQVAELAAACAHLPLALRIAAANLAEQSEAGRVQPDVAGYLRALRSDRALVGLQVDGDPEASVKAALDLSYRALSPPAQTLFRRLGLSPGADITPEAATALIDTALPDCRRLLDVLAAAHLVTERQLGRYALHDLLRQFARELGRAGDTDASRLAAVGRLYDHYLSSVDAAARLLYPSVVRIPVEPTAERPPAVVPPFPDEAAALAWLDAELPNLVAAATHAAEHGPQRASWLLADALRGYFWIRRHTSEWLVTAEAGLSAARAAGDKHGEAAAHLSLALAYRSLTDFEMAISHAAAALPIARDLDWLDVQASTLSSLAVSHAETGETRAALALFGDAHAVAQRMGKPVALAMLLANRSTLRHNMGDLRGSLHDALAALAICEKENSPGAQALAHCGAGGNYVYLGQFDRAADHLAQGHGLFERIGEVYGQAIARGLMAKLHYDTGHCAEALRHSAAGLALGREAHDPSVEAVMFTDLTFIRTQLGQYDQALQDGAEALDLARRAKSSHAEVEALIAIADAHRHAGNPDDALRIAQQALAIADQREYRLLHADALTSIAGTQLSLGDRDAAAKTGRAALDMHQEIGYWAGTVRTEALLAEAVRTSHS